MVTNFEPIRAQARASGEESRVETNQRHLIDKILARYSAEFTIYRELIQNSDDAGSSRVEITFREQTNSEPTGSENSEQAPLVSQVEFTNNGKPFGPADWKRLQSIAEGNPDPAKIGFFGVGFYSVFSVSEEPMVLSKAHCLTFHWKKDSLFANRLQLSNEDRKQEGATFVLPIRNPFPTPEWTTFAKFLASLLTFTRNLTQITVQLEQHCVIRLQRSDSQPTSTPVPGWPFALASGPLGLLTLLSAESRKLRLELSLQQPNVRGDLEKSHVTVEQHRGTFSSTVPRQLSNQMERVTKKPPPQSCEIACIVASDNRFVPDSDQSSHSMLQELLSSSFVPDVTSGRVYIGFPTHQTTGGAFHLAAPLIPTVERESIDFVDRSLCAWNQEVLVATGVFARLLYDKSMTEIHQAFLTEPEKENPNFEEPAVGQLKPSDDSDKSTGIFRVFKFVADTAAVVSRAANGALATDVEVESIDRKPLKESEIRALSIIHSHTFRNSTPSSFVAQLLRKGFLLRSSSSPSLITTQGCHPADCCRIPDGGLERFTLSLPVVRPRVYQSSRHFIEHVLAKKVAPVTVQDMCRDLAGRQLQADEFVRLVRFWIRFKRRRPALSKDNMTVRNAILLSPGVQLRSFHYYAPAKVFPEDLPLPGSSVPRFWTKPFAKRDMDEELGWFEPLPFLTWCEFVCQCDSVIQDEGSRSTLLTALNEEFRLQKFVDRRKLMSTVQPLLANQPCLPTTHGILAPESAYLSSMAALFPDLPKVTFSEDSKLSKGFLVELGVRQYLELDVLFSRLDKLNWDREPTALVKYLASVQDQLRPKDWIQLRETRFLPRAGSNGKTLMGASELHFPSETARMLDLPMLSWPSGQILSDKSPEKKLLRQLGMLAYPTFSYLVDQLSDPCSPHRRALLLDYLAENIKQYPEYQANSLAAKIIPDEGGSLRAPSDIFTESKVEVMHLPVVANDTISVAKRLGVRPVPSAEELVNQVLRSVDWPDAEMGLVFDFLSGHCRAFGSNERAIISKCAFIPVQSSNGVVRRRRPSECYTRSDSTLTPFTQIFETVDFGQSGNLFLNHCGTRNEPTVDDVCRLILTSPQKLLTEKLNGDEDSYMELLRQIAGRMGEMSSDIRRSLSRATWLLGQRRSQGRARFFCQAKECCLVDDTILEQLFDPVVVPSDFGLEKMCLSLGTKWLSEEVTRHFSWAGELRETPLSRDLESMIHQRAPLLLNHDSRRAVSSSATTMLGKGLQCRQVDTIECMLTFRNIRKGQRTTSHATIEKAKTALIVYITASMDYFDVGQALARQIFKQSRLEDTFLVAQILETPLATLRSRGFPVDRVIRPPSPPPIPTAPHQPITSSSTGSSDLGSSTVQGQSIPRRSESTSNASTSSLKKRTEGFVEILGNMFPDCDKKHIESLVATQSRDHLQRASNALAEGNYPKVTRSARSKGADDRSISGRTQSQSGTPANSTLRKLKQAVGLSQSSKGLSSLLTNSSGLDKRQEKQPVVPRETDPAFDQHHAVQMDRILGDAAQSCKKPPRRASTTDTVIPVSKELTSSSPSCEIVPGHDLEPCSPPPSFTANRSLRVLQKRGMSETIDWESCARFSVILRGLGRHVFDVPIEALSIYHDPGGRTIAFNAGRSLHFNLRFFRSLHEHLDPAQSSVPWAYWYVIFCHELAHNFVAEHDQRHEHYMEAFAQSGIPKLAELLP